MLVHVVFATKNREKVLSAAVREELFRYLAKSINNEGFTAHTVNGGLEHVHVLLRLPLDRTLSDLMRGVKAHSSKWLRRKIPAWPGWQSGYSAFSVSYSQYETVYSYIERQEAHHRKQPFEAELISLLKKNEIDYDERYLWS